MIKDTPIRVVNDSTNETRELYWDEENQLMGLSDNGKTSRYTYNAAGERIMKSYGTMEGVYINGAPQGITFHETDNFTLYPASILSVNKNRFTKHYFIGDKRVASRIGTGLFNNVYGRNGSYVTAGQQDYAERMNQIQKQKEAYYKQQGIQAQGTVLFMEDLQQLGVIKTGREIEVVVFLAHRSLYAAQGDDVCTKCPSVLHTGPGPACQSRQDTRGAEGHPSAPLSYHRSGRSTGGHPSCAPSATAAFPPIQGAGSSLFPLMCGRRRRA